VSSADCPAQSPACCLSQQTNSSGVAECMAACGGGDAQLCDPNAADPGCQNGQQCQPPNGGVPLLPDGVWVCGG
jgi:hypothetical protein